MQPFKLTISEINRSLLIEPAQQINTYKIYDDSDGLPDNSAEDIEDMPADRLLGNIHIKNAKEFTFNGTGVFSGEDLRFLVNFLVSHPSFTAGNKA